MDPAVWISPHLAPSGRMSRPRRCGNTPGRGRHPERGIDVDKGTCGLAGCDRPEHCKGLCVSHYHRRQKHGPDFDRSPIGRLSPTGPCTVEGCDRDNRTDGLCAAHYQRLRKYGDPLGGGPSKASRPRGEPAPRCSVEGCDRVAKSRGWCQKHWKRWYEHGDPLFVERIIGDTVARFWSKVDKDGPLPMWAPFLGPCWLWTTYVNVDGYGVFSEGQRTMLAPRWAYENEHGPIADGQEPDHLCRTPACVRPAHLEPVPHAENVRRGRSGENQRIKTHCPQNHPYNEVNTRINTRGGRVCRICQREAVRKSRLRRLGREVGATSIHA